MREAVEVIDEIHGLPTTHQGQSTLQDVECATVGDAELLGWDGLGQSDCQTIQEVSMILVQQKEGTCDI